ncbi:MAG: hypothetical protein HYX74_04210 [Acidobacteria bacterium]|nr:hypothetical protein [Acidobacteriota bacterium]
MKRFLWVASVTLWACLGGLLRAQSPPVLSATYQFPFWSDGDVDSGEKDFHIGYRTGFVITNPTSDFLTVDLDFVNSEGIPVFPRLSDGLTTTRILDPRATINVTTLAAWNSPQRFGYVTARGSAQFLISVQLELVHIPNPAIASLVASDPRISVLRIEPARNSGQVLVSWEQSATTDTAFIFANISGDVAVGTVTAFSGAKQVQTFNQFILATGNTIIRTIRDFDGNPSLLNREVERNHGYLRIDSPVGVIVVGVVFRTVQDPIVMPAALAAP